MKKYLLPVIYLLFFGTAAIAQKEPKESKETKAEKRYKERAADVQQEVWGMTDNAFNVTTVPDKYKDESAVIIARSITINVPASHVQPTIGSAPQRQYKYYKTYRERVLIQDKSALEEYSTLAYKKVAGDLTTQNWIDKDGNTTKTYVGAKIYKQGGKIVTVNSLDEEVIIQGANKEKKGKIAIPDLQIGDIIDYYFRTEQSEEGAATVQGPTAYFLADLHPILYYAVHYDLNRKCGIDLMSVNGANKLRDSIGKDDDLLIGFTERDLPKISSKLWTSLARAIPYYIIRYGFVGGGASLIAKAGEIQRGPYADIYKDNLKKTFYIMARTADKSPNKSMLDYFGGKKTTRDLPADSIANYFYNYYRWSQYGTFTNMEITNERNDNGMNPYTAAVSFTEMLKLHDISSDLVLVSDRFSQRLQDVFSAGDFDVLVKVKEDSKLTWFSFNSFFQDAGKITANFQGEKALLLTREGGKLAKFKDTEEPLTLPVSKSSDNTSVENLTVNFNKDNLQVITIDRNCKETGSMKQSDQRNLLLPEDVEANLAGTIGLVSTTNILAEKRETRAQATEIQAALDKERLNQKDYFKKEIKDQYDQDAKELNSYKIDNIGLSIYSPVFEFSENFTMDNFVKKAGNNYIFDIGKLMGSYSGVDKKDETRTLDVYMPNARTLTYNFSVTIPEGYVVKGIDVLNKKVENDIASFVSTAKLSGNVVTVSVIRTYKNNFEPAANWPKLTSIINASADFTNQKLLLEKK